jgi:hypothetical protein
MTKGEPTRGRTVRKGRREFKDAVLNMPMRNLKCRTWLHWWNDDLSDPDNGAVIIRITEREVTVLIKCMRCGSTKPVTIARKGPRPGEKIHTGGYRYPHDYEFDFPLTKVERQAIYAIVAESIAEQAFELEMAGLVETTPS